MAAPASKRQKRGARAEESDEPEALEITTNTKRPLCIICGNMASSKVLKDHNYDSMMQLYWCTLGVDVKPQECNKSDLCVKCFDKVVNFYETNDIIVYFETYFKSLRAELLKRTLKGITTMEKDGNPLAQVHKDIKTKYGDNPDVTEREEEQIQQTLDTYNMETFIKEDDDSRVIRLNKNSDEGNGTGKKDAKKQQALKISLKSSSKHASRMDTTESEEESD